jgi:protein-L-isoaspartate(D-aspartate) O-methyltransferase
MVWALNAFPQSQDSLPKTTITKMMNIDWSRFNGTGMTSPRTRARMVTHLREQGIRDEIVLAAMNTVPRHFFVEDALAPRAYENNALPIGYGQTISQPWVVARMTELARNGKNLNNVLEVGTASGYQAAVLSLIAQHVFTVERIQVLYARAKRRFQELKLTNVAVKYGDALAGFPDAVKFDAIIVTAGSTILPEVLLDFLSPGGRMVIPLIDERAEPINGEPVQRLTVVEKDSAGGFYKHAYEFVQFVPLLAGVK